MATKVVRRKLATGEVKEYVYEDYCPSMRTTRAVRQQATRSGLVYFVRAESGPIKIGFTYDFPRRFLNLQQSNHERLYPMAVFAADNGLERRLKFLFKGLNIRGEWFRDDAIIRREIDELKRTLKHVANFSAIANAYRMEKISAFAQSKAIQATEIE